MNDAPVLSKPLTNSVAQPLQNSSVEQITIEEMLKGVEDTDENLYFQLKNNPKEPEKARGVYGKYRTSNFDACLSYNV